METKQNSTGTIARLRFLLAAGCILSGWLAGGNVDRYIVEFPSWQHAGVLSWAAYSRHADLGNGVFFYPFEAIGSFILLLACSLIVMKKQALLGRIVLPVHFATIFSIAGLVLTFFAAPVMLGLKTIGDDTGLLQQAFHKFYFWSFYRAIAQVLSFFFCVWAMKKGFFASASTVQ